MYDYAENYYCEEKFPTGPETFNVTGAEKVGETEVDGRVVREFVITTPVTKMQHNFLTGFDPDVAYTGESTVKYFDDKLTGAPVKFSFGGKVIVVTHYDEREISLPPADDSFWDPTPECLNMTVRDHLKDAYLPTPVSPNVYAIDYRRRDVDYCIDNGGCALSEDQPPHPDDFFEDAANGTRKLLARKKRKRTKHTVDSEADGPASSGDNGAGSGACTEDTGEACHAMGHDVFGVGRTYTYQFPPPALEPPAFFNIEMWQNGCGIKSASLTSECPAGIECSVTANWNGDKVCCEDGTYCGPGGSLTGTISYDLLNLIKKPNVREFLEDEGVAGSVELSLSYAQSRGSKGRATVEVVGSLSLDRSYNIYRRRLQEDQDSFEALEASDLIPATAPAPIDMDEDEEGADDDDDEDEAQKMTSGSVRQLLRRGNRPAPTPSPPRYCINNAGDTERTYCSPLDCGGRKRLACSLKQEVGCYSSREKKRLRNRCDEINNTGKKRCLFGVCGFIDDVGAFISETGQAIADSGTIKNTASLTVSGYAAYDFDDESLGFGAEINGEICILSICAAFDADISTED